MPAETSNQGALQFPQEQFRSDIPQQNITMSGQPDMTGQAFSESAPVFPQYTPQSDYLTETPGDDLAASEYISGYLHAQLEFLYETFPRINVLIRQR